MRIAWVLSGDRNKASSRLQGFRIHEELVAQGRHSAVLMDDFSTRAPTMRSPAFRSAAGQLLRGQFTHLVTEGPEWTAVQLAQFARCRNIGAIAVRCDRYPFDYDRYFDLTILPTTALRDELRVRRAAVIDDMIECPQALFKSGYQPSGDRLRIVWVGHSGYADYIAEFSRELFSDPVIAQNFELITISSGPQFTHQWHAEHVFEDILGADIGILPIPEGAWFSTKSSNRLTMMFSLGMPCIASPIESYRAIGRDGENLFFASDVATFRAHLLAMRDASLRERLDRAARAGLDPAWRPGPVAQRWAAALRQVPDPMRCDSPVSWRYRIMAPFIGL